MFTAYTVIWMVLALNFFSADSVWHSSLASQEELQEVIQLLSCRPGVGHSTQLYHPSQHLPGEIFMQYSFLGDSD
jgi:hypothetical protein